MRENLSCWKWEKEREREEGGRNGHVTWEVLNIVSGILKDFNKQTSTRMTQSGSDVGKSSHPIEGAILIIHCRPCGRGSPLLLTVSQGCQTQGPACLVCAHSIMHIVLWVSGGGNPHLESLSCP